MGTSWSAVLDEMERRVEQAARDLEAGHPAFEPVEIPPGVGPLPADCRARARAVQESTRQLEERIQASMAQLSGLLGRRTVAETRPAPSFVDRRA